MRRMRHLQRGQPHQKAYQQEHFSNQLLFNSQYYQSFGHQAHNPRCIRPKSVPLSSEETRTIAQERPMALRTNSDPMYSGSFGSSIEHPEMSQSMDSFGLLLNQSSLSSIAPHIEDGSGFSMGDVFSRSDESLMKLTESGKDSFMPSVAAQRRSLPQSFIGDWKKDISMASDPGLPLWGSSEVWWNNGLSVQLKNPVEESQLNTQSEKQVDKSGYDDVELFSNEEKKDSWETTVVDDGDGQALSVQDQQTLQHTQETLTQTPDVLNVNNVGAAETTVESTSSVNITNNPLPIITSTSMKDTNAHVLVSTVPSEKQQEVKVRAVRGFVSGGNSVESSNSQSLVEIQVQENDVHEELKKVRDELAEAKEKLNEKEEELENTQKMVEALKKVIFLDSSVKKKFCRPKTNEQGAKVEDVSNRCPNCIQILNNLESCKECMM